MKNSKDLIKFLKISKLYENSKTKSLDDVSFDIKEKTIHGIIGPNGSGKTTMFNILSKIIFPSSGSIIIKGLKIEDYFLNENLSYISSEIVFPDLTVEEYIFACGYFLELNKKEISDLINNNSIKDYRLKKCISLSTGWKKILQVFTSVNLRKLAKKNSKIIIMDEPFNGLDPLVRKDLLNIIKKLVELEEYTVIISTHILNDLEILEVENVTMIKKGKILYSGPKPKNIEKNYNDLFYSGEASIFEN